MPKKFTEEQYQQIVEAWDNDGDYKDALSLVIEVVDDFEDGYSYNEALTLANPRSREWAHEQFVEKEKRYMWRLKTDKNLVISKLFDGWFVDEAPSGKMRFSEKEINNSPFKTEWFDKEEAD